MSLKLFVDDVRVPEDIYPGEADDWHLCRTITEAIRLLATRDDVVHISLDHDIQCGSVLGEHGFWTGGHTSPETYEPVAWYLEMQMEVLTTPQPFKITLHSANPVGRTKMHNILREVCKENNVPINELPDCAATGNIE